MQRNTVNTTTPAIRTEGNIEVLADFPAFRYIRAMPWTIFKHGSTFAIPYESRNHGTLHHQFKLGSVIGYAVECGDDPIANLEQAKSRGHDLHWANACATVISTMQKAKETIFVLNFGDEITFEGIRFRLDKAPNNNVKLTPVLKDIG